VRHTTSKRSDVPHASLLKPDQDLLQVPESDRKTPDQILNLPIATSAAGAAAGASPSGQPSQTYVRLRQVATQDRALGPNEIPRQDSQRYIGITAVAQGRPQSEILKDLQKMMSTRLRLSRERFQKDLVQAVKLGELNPNMDVLLTANRLVHWVSGASTHALIAPAYYNKRYLKSLIADAVNELRNCKTAPNLHAAAS